MYAMSYPMFLCDYIVIWENNIRILRIFVSKCINTRKKMFYASNKCIDTRTKKCILHQIITVRKVEMIPT